MIILRTICMWTLALAISVNALAEAKGEQPRQVDVSVKIVEFQTNSILETGFSAYFVREAIQRPYGRVSSGRGAITTADLTFPTNGNPTITAFLDRIAISEGDIELILQALAEENRAFILSKPKAKVVLGSSVTIGTETEVPYEATKVVGPTAQQITQFRPTGVSMTLNLHDIIDDDGDWTQDSDTYINLTIDASVRELGQNFVVALDDGVLPATNFSQSQNALSAPEFITRAINTNVWVRSGQVLVLGGLYRRTHQKSLRTAPMLTQLEDFTINMAENIVPGNFLASPLSATIGNRASAEEFRELVFIVKADVWRPSGASAYKFFDDVEDSDEEEKEATTPGNLIKDVLTLPRDIAEGITGEPENDGSVEKNLGSPRDE